MPSQSLPLSSETSLSNRRALFYCGGLLERLRRADLEPGGDPAIEPSSRGSPAARSRCLWIRDVDLAGLLEMPRMRDAVPSGSTAASITGGGWLHGFADVQASCDSGGPSQARGSSREQTRDIPPCKPLERGHGPPDAALIRLIDAVAL